MTSSARRFDGRLLLIYLFPGLGDAVLLAPVVQALLRESPTLRIHLLARHVFARLWQHIDLPVAVHLFPEELVDREYTNIDQPVGPPHEHDPQVVDGRRQALESELAAYRFDVAVDLTLKSGIDSRYWLTASRATVRRGWMRLGETASGAGLSYGALDVRDAMDRHWSEYCLLPLGDIAPPAPDHDFPWRFRTGSTPSISTAPGVVLIPGSSIPSKRWPVEHFIEIGSWLTEEHAVTVTVVGSRSEEELVSSIVRGIGDRAEAYCGTSFRELLGVIAHANFVVSNDTGPMQLAFALGTPTVAIFLHTSPRVWGPQRLEVRHVILRQGESPVLPRQVRHAVGSILESGPR